MVERLVGRAWVNNLPRFDRGGAAKDHKVDQRVRAEAVGPMYRGTARFTHRHQARNNCVRVFRCWVQDFAPIIGWNTAHIVMHGWQNRDWFLGQIAARDNACALRDAGQAQGQCLRRKVVKVEVNMVSVLAHTTALTDFHGHATADHIA